MKKIVLFAVLLSFTCGLFSIVPAYHGARSLSLGYAGSAFSYDVNAIFINPSMLSSLPYKLTGYQYQNSYLDYKDFSDTLSQVLDANLEQFESLPAAEKGIVFSQLQDLFESKTGIYGFSANVPGFISRNFGISASLVNTAIMNPVKPDTGFFEKDPETVSNDEIASLEMNFIGLRYKQVSLSYSFPLFKNVYFGVTLHYLNGEITEFNASINDELFSKDLGSRDYLELAWDGADEKFSKLVADVSLSMDVGRYFRVALVTKNVGDPRIKTPLREITLKRRVIAGLALRPDQQWGIYLDMDIAKTNRLYNGEEIQPLSIGIEKGFFENRFFVRAGFLSDITEKQFFGTKSNVLYGIGLGFNMKRIVVDFAVGMNSSGTVKNLAISGFFIFK